jgi:hypothetical protein
VLPEAYGWGAAETRFAWPEAARMDGQQARIDQTGAASLKQARKFYVLPETSVNWAGLLHSATGNWLRLDWDANQIPYLGIWVDEGALSHTTVVALEPATGFFDNLALAWDKQKVAIVEPGGSHTWMLAVRLGTDAQSFPMNNQ